MVRFRSASTLAVGLLAGTTLVGCYGTPFDKGDNPGAGAGTGRPQRNEIDQALTGGMGSPRGQEKAAGPGQADSKPTSTPGTGAR